MKYQPSEIEPKWQKAWKDHQAFKTPTELSELKKKPKFYALDMFPYPSGAGLHVGHPEGYTATDIVSRYKRAKGFYVLHPMGWDAFGLPAERAAIRENIHPAKITKRNITNFKRQIERLGFSYDWDREVNTSSSDYYKWTQWIFLKLYEKNLAYLAEVPVNWCPALSTVLANEEVKDGKYVETGDEVERRMMKQWMLKIPVYAERLLEDLEGLDWPDGVKQMQRHWIGKSHGAEFSFKVDGSGESFRVFSTRPDTLFGATYCVLAPEHPLVAKITKDDQKVAVQDYVAEATQKTDLSRTDLATDKTGVFTGAYAVNPVNQEKLPIWVADYVLMSYGTGAIMAVPGHDERDHEFARKFQLPIREVVAGGDAPIEEKPYIGEGKLVNSDFLDDLGVDDGIQKITKWLKDKEIGVGKVQYRLRDWLFSRQRYWGEPFPLTIGDDGTVHPVAEKDLPVELPELTEFKPTDDGQPPLARAKEWLKTPQGTRETNTMPQWAGSCWYYLRYVDAQNAKAPWDKELEKYWMPVDLYIGGVEHAVLHLLYARFWHKVLYDCGWVSTKEPFQKLYNQGMILAHSYQDKAGKYYSPDEVNRKGPKPLSPSGEPLKVQIEKMSKSKHNVTNPDDVIDQYGADALRIYEMFMGPLDATKPWQTDGVEGVFRFLSRVWRLIVNEETNELRVVDSAGASEMSLWKSLHKTIKKVGEDIERLSMNTAVSQMMIFVNDATKSKSVPKETAKIFLQVLAPFAPHLSEELWERLGEKGLICQRDWPAFDPALCEDDAITVVILINGKKRGELSVAKDTGKGELEKLAFANEKAIKFMEGKKPKKVIVVPNKLVNIVV